MSRFITVPQRPRSALLLAALAVTLALWSCAFGLSNASAAARTSLPVIERQVMCVTCKIPLNVAQSPQADRERSFIQGLIDQGESEAQVKHALVGQYGPAVLGLPGAHGFDLTAYLVPLAVVLGLLALLVVLLPRWRRHASQNRGTGPSALDGSTPKPPLAGPDAARLNADLARFDP